MSRSENERSRRERSNERRGERRKEGNGDAHTGREAGRREGVGTPSLRSQRRRGMDGLGDAEQREQQGDGVRLRSGRRADAGLGNPGFGGSTSRSASREDGSGKRKKTGGSRKRSALRVGGTFVLFCSVLTFLCGMYLYIQPASVPRASASETISSEQLEGIGRSEGSGAIEGEVGPEPAVEIGDGGGSGTSGGADGNGFSAEGPPPEKGMRLSIPAMERVEDTPVIDGSRASQEEALRKGTLHAKSTGFPWEEDSNTFIAGHRLGYPGTGSHLVFYDLDKLENGDKVMLTDSAGRSYEYRVYKKMVVSPDETRVMSPVKGKDIVTLQTCTLPTYSERLIVRAERV